MMAASIIQMKGMKQKHSKESNAELKISRRDIDLFTLEPEEKSVQQRDRI